MTARESALRALYDIEEKGAFINAAINDALKGGFSAADKGFITELIYGVVANKSAIDFIISRFSKIKLKKLSPWVLQLLRLGVFQIYYMDRVPHSAACNEAVKLAKKYSHGAGAGFVNGVLRSVSRSCGGEMFPKTGDIVKDLSLEYSYPEWLTKRLVEEYGEKRCKDLYEENRKAHGNAVRVNTLKASKEELKKILSAEGFECSDADGVENALTVFGKLDINSSQAYKSGLFSLQNLSSQKAVMAVDAKPNDFVIDMCAAPGGKSCGIAEQMENKGRVLAFDIFEHKTKLIENSAKRLGINIIETRTADSSKVCEELAGKADRVLADVPCSGFGVIHKKPDIKWSRKEADIDELCQIQREILNAAAAYVRTGGVLVYSTCTILPEENRLQIERFLSEHREFEKVSEEQLLTSENGESGFYICKMLKG